MIGTVSQLCPVGAILGSPGLNQQIISFIKPLSIDYWRYIRIEVLLNVGPNWYAK